mmetsp:Transcript_4074/g.11547  ORF Transcript_4074/g.11547 Transcript_4074/m.11547 type:complete len:398 (+) Transcript_4074:1994-3187(+)
MTAFAVARDLSITDPVCDSFVHCRNSVFTANHLGLAQQQRSLKGVREVHPQIQSDGGLGGEVRDVGGLAGDGERFFHQGIGVQSNIATFEHSVAVLQCVLEDVEEWHEVHVLRFFGRHLLEASQGFEFSILIVNFRILSRLVNHLGEADFLLVQSAFHSLDVEGDAGAIIDVSGCHVQTIAEIRLGVLVRRDRCDSGFGDSVIVLVDGDGARIQVWSAHRLSNVLAIQSHSSQGVRHCLKDLGGSVWHRWLREVKVALDGCSAGLVGCADERSDRVRDGGSSGDASFFSGEIGVIVDDGVVQGSLDQWKRGGWQHIPCHGALHLLAVRVGNGVLSCLEVLQQVTVQVGTVIRGAGVEFFAKFVGKRKERMAITALFSARKRPLDRSGVVGNGLIPRL